MATAVLTTVYGARCVRRSVMRVLLVVGGALVVTAGVWAVGAATASGRPVDESGPVADEVMTDDGESEPRAGMDRADPVAGSLANLL